MKDLSESRNLVRRITDIVLEKKGSNITVLDLRKISAMVDYFVITTAGSDIHARAIADNIGRKLRKQGIHRWHVEGHAHAHWILLDYVDVVVHIFLDEERAYYNIESLWGDAPTEYIGTDNE